MIDLCPPKNTLKKAGLLNYKSKINKAPYVVYEVHCCMNNEVLS